MEVSSSSRSGSGSRASIIEIALDVLNVGNMIILLKDCLNSETERKSEQIQQMYKYNLDKNQTAL